MNKNRKNLIFSLSLALLITALVWLVQGSGSLARFEFTTLDWRFGIRKKMVQVPAFPVKSIEAIIVLKKVNRVMSEFGSKFRTLYAGWLLYCTLNSSLSIL